MSRSITIAVLLATFTLPQVHAATRGALASGDPASPKPTAPASDSGVTVSRIRGQAFRIGKGGVYTSLRPGAAIAIDQPLGVGGKSRMDLLAGNDGAMELGPGARLSLQPATHDGGKGTSAVAYRLERGYLKVRWEGGRRSAPLEVSFGQWMTLLEPGEYVFDAQEPESSVCTLSGALQISDASQSKPTSLPSDCLLLGAHAPTTVTLRPTDRKQVESARALQPVIAEANLREVKEALAGMEAEYAGASRRKAAPTADTTARPAKSDDAVSRTAARTEAADVEPISDPLLIVPRTRAARIAPPRTISPEPIDAMARRVDRAVARAQSKLADALVASAGRSAEVAAVSDESAPAAVPPSPTVNNPTKGSSPSNDPAASDRLEATAVPVAEMKGAAAPDVPLAERASHDAAMTQLGPEPNAAGLQLAIDAEFATFSPEAPVGPTAAPMPTRSEASLKPVRNPAPSTPKAPMPALRAVATPPSPLFRPQVAENARPTPQAVEVASAAPVLASPNNPFAGSSAAVPAPPPLEWIVNVATFPSRESAEQQAEQLRSQSLTSGIRSETVRGRSSYRVVIEGLASEEAANTVLHLLVSQLGLREAWAFRKY